MPGIAVSSPSFSHIPIEECAPAVADQFSVWEIVAEHRHHLRAIGTFLSEFLRSRPLALQVHAPLSDINIASFSERVREASLEDVVETIRLSAGLGARCVTVHPGLVSPSSSLDLERVRALARSSVLRLSKASEEYGVPVAVENMPRMRWLVYQEPAELLGIIEGTELGVCFDAGHANTCGNTERWLELRDRFMNVHIHDNRGERDEHLVLGEGTVPVARILDALHGVYKGNYVIESSDLAQGVRSRDILKRMLARQR